MGQPDFHWQEIRDGLHGAIWRCQTQETTIDIYPRPSYCDRGRWQVYVDSPDFPNGYPANQSPFDSADGFPRYFFSLDRAKAEMEDMLKFRGYHPVAP